MRKLIIGLVVLASAFLGVGAAIVQAPAPAFADHDNDVGHWNQPPLVISQASLGFDSVIQDAAYYWQDVAFFGGYYPPLPSHNDVYPGDCGAYIGRINVCPVVLGDPRLAGADQGHVDFADYNDGSGHIAWAVIYYNSALTGATMQNTMRHEFGHALGLGHYNKPGSTHPVTCDLMNSTPCGPYASSIDTSSIYIWQPPYHARNT